MWTAIVVACMLIGLFSWCIWREIGITLRLKDSRDEDAVANDLRKFDHELFERWNGLMAMFEQGNDIVSLMMMSEIGDISLVLANATESGIDELPSTVNVLDRMCKFICLFDSGWKEESFDRLVKMDERLSSIQDERGMSLACHQLHHAILIRILLLNGDIR